MRAKLEKIIDALCADLTKSNHWHEVQKTNLLNHPINPYARIKFGKIMSNGLHEAATSYYVIYWDGSIQQRATL